LTRFTDTDGQGQNYEKAHLHITSKLHTKFHEKFQTVL
jgi:hypothetical protein